MIFYHKFYQHQHKREERLALAALKQEFLRRLAEERRRKLAKPA